MTTLVALILAGMFTVLKPVHEANEALYNKKAILSAVAKQLDTPISDMKDDQVVDLFTNSIEQKVLNMSGEEISSDAVVAAGYKGGKAEDINIRKEKKKPESERLNPLYIYTNSKGEKTYIMSLVGNGLWDEIWGNIALEGDLKTIAGVAFDHAAETPGLGAEIKDNNGWKNQFIGKKIYADNGDYTSIGIVKGGVKQPSYQVDGISGATITGVGVEEMMKRGMKYYEPYFDKIKK